MRDSLLEQGAAPRAVYCSAACRARQWRHARRIRRRAAAERDGEERRVCPVCEVVWVAGVDHRSNAVYCSAKCRGRAAYARRKAFAEAPNPRLGERSD
ncbi:hypothetical protein GCM10010129_57720 [Streptomyces fumigatiscleroticus]|nr:hypothetical protein GCM10010129_57720 [Streptomyces fumigatiscleroticus]